VQVHSRHDGNEFVGNPAEQVSAEPGILAVHSPSGNDVKAFVELREKWSNVRRIVLKISIHRNQDFATRKMDTCHQRRGLARVPAQAYDSKLEIVHPPKRARGFVGAPIVHDNDFIIQAERVESLTEGREQLS
jgi:hypothetical protein